jgi:hypothetical protein
VIELSALDQNEDIEDDSDPWDVYSTDASGLGLLVRTDFSDEEAWQAFATRLQDAEHEMAPDHSPSKGDQAMNVEEDEGEDSSDDEGGRPPIFAVLNPHGDTERKELSGISNLGALRLLCDVDVHRAPPRPADTRPIATPNRLIDRGGLQETYEGKGVWIYDAKSNVDQAVRVVNLQGDVYGTATWVNNRFIRFAGVDLCMSQG